MSWKRSLAVPLALVAALMSWAGGATIASAAANDASVRLAYLAPDGPDKVDYYIDGSRVLAGATYTTISLYQAVSAGPHDFKVLTAGSPASAAPLSETQQTLSASGFYTIATGGRMSDGLKSGMFSDGMQSPPSGQAVVRFLHMAPLVPGVDIVTGGNAVFTNISFLQSSPYAPVPAGSYDLKLEPTGHDDADALFTASGVGVTAGTVRTLIGIGGVNRPVALLTAYDAASASQFPNGGAGTGEGGTAYGGALQMGMIAFALIATVCLSLLARRRRSA
jgi:hypothetical protein